MYEIDASLRRRQAGHMTPIFLLLLLHLHLQSSFGSFRISPLTFGIVLYVLLKLSVVPGLCAVVDAQELAEASLFDLPTTNANPYPSETPCSRALHAAVNSKTSPMVGNSQKSMWHTSYGTVKCTALVGRYKRANTMIKSS